MIQRADEGVRFAWPSGQRRAPQAIPPCSHFARGSPSKSMVLWRSLIPRLSPARQPGGGRVGIPAKARGSRKRPAGAILLSGEAGAGARARDAPAASRAAPRPRPHRAGVPRRPRPRPYPPSRPHHGGVPRRPRPRPHRAGVPRLHRDGAPLPRPRGRGAPIVRRTWRWPRNRNAPLHSPGKHVL